MLIGKDFVQITRFCRGFYAVSAMVKLSGCGAEILVVPNNTTSSGTARIVRVLTRVATEKKNLAQRRRPNRRISRHGAFLHSM